MDLGISEMAKKILIPEAGLQTIGKVPYKVYQVEIQHVIKN